MCQIVVYDALHTATCPVVGTSAVRVDRAIGTIHNTQCAQLRIHIVICKCWHMFMINTGRIERGTTFAHQFITCAYKRRRAVKYRNRATFWRTQLFYIIVCAGWRIIPHMTIKLFSMRQRNNICLSGKQRRCIFRSTQQPCPNLLALVFWQYIQMTNIGRLILTVAIQSPNHSVTVIGPKRKIMR